MRSMLIIIIIGLLGIGGYLAYTVRTVTHDPAVWHVDPLTVPPSPTPNSYRVAIPDFTEYPVGRAAPIYAADARTVAAAFDAFVMAQPRVERVAGSPEEGWITYVQRTETLQMPDYISVRFYDLDTGPTPGEDVSNPGPEEAQPEAGPDAQADAQVGPGDEDAPVEALPSGTPRSTLAIYSRSRFGHGDMGVNEARVNAWLAALESLEE